MDAFDAIFADTSKTTGSVRQKRADGTVRTAKLGRGPVGMEPSDFADASMHGASFAESAGDSDSRRTRNRKDVTGAAARSAVIAMLGFQDAGTIPPSVRRRGRNTTPSENGAASTEANAQ